MKFRRQSQPARKNSRRQKKQARSAIRRESNLSRYTILGHQQLEDRRMLAWDLTLNLGAGTTNVSSNTVGTTTTFTATGTGASVDVIDIGNALGAGDNVVVNSGSTGTEAGDITDNAGSIGIFPGINNLSLTFESGSGAGLVGNIALDGLDLAGSGQSIIIDAAGSATSTGADPIADTNLTVDAGTGITLTTSVSNLTATNTTSGDIDITQAASPVLPLATAGTGVVDNAATGTINLTNLGSSITVGALSGVRSTNGNITLAGTDLQLNDTVNSGTARTTLTTSTAGEAIDLGTNTAGTVGLTASELNEVTAGVLQVGSPAAGSLTVSAPVSGTNFSTLDLISGDAITESGTGLITVGELSLAALNGIGTSASPLQTQVSTLGADTSTGGIFITNGVTTPVTLNIAGTDGVRDTGASGDIDLVNSGSVDIITFNDIVKGPGNVTVEALGANADVLTGGGNNFDAIVSGPGTLTVTAGEDIIIGNPPGGVGNRIGDVEAGSTGVNASIVFSAGRDIVVQVDSFVDAHGTGTVTATAGTAGGPGNISVLTNGAPPLAGARISTEGGDIALTTGAGGTFTLDSGAAGSVSSTLNGGNGNITISADSMTLNDPVDAGTGIVQLEPVTSGQAVSLGTTVAGQLSLLQTDLNNVTASVLRVGSLTTGGSIAVNAPITDVGTGFNTLSLLTGLGGAISQGAGDTLTVTNLQAAGEAGVTLNEDNVVDTLAGASDTSNPFSFTDHTNLTLGTVDSGLGFGFGTGIIGGGPISLTVDVAGDSLTVNQPIDTTHFNGGVGQNINLTADQMTFTAAINAGTGGTVTLQPFTASENTVLGGTVAGELSLTNADLGQVTAKVLQIGSATYTGNITVMMPISAPNVGTIALVTSGEVMVQGAANAVNTATVTRDLTDVNLDDVSLPGAPTITIPTSSSFDFIGGGGTATNQLIVTEDANDLPLFNGTAAGSHTNAAFTASSPNPTNVGINFSGAGASDSMVFNFINSHDITEFSDNVGAANSGVVTLPGFSNVSFEGLKPITYHGAGGTLTLSDAANPTVSSLTVTAGPGAGQNQVTGNGTWETATLDGWDSLLVQGINANNNVITLASADGGTVNGHALTAVTLQGGAGDDTLVVNSLPATITATMLGGDGTNQFTLDNATHNLQSILGPVIVSPAGDSTTALDTLNIIDSGDPVGRTVAITASTIDGITGDTTPPAITYDDSGRIRQVNISGGSGGNTFNIQSTNVSTNTLPTHGGYIINTGTGTNTINVSSTAPTVNGNGTLTGNLAGIQGEVGLIDAGSDTLNVSDYGGPTGQTYSIQNFPGLGTLVSATGMAGVEYNLPVGVPALQNLNLIGSSAGGNTYNIDDTTATTETTVQDGDASSVGKLGSTFNITGDNLSANNTFNGEGGGNTFFLNIAADLFANSVIAGPTTANSSLTIAGDGGGNNPGSDTVRNKLIVNDAAATARSLNWAYQDNTGGDLNIAGEAANSGLAGAVVAGDLPVQVRSMQTVIMNHAANNDADQVTGTSGNDDVLTVAEMPTNAGDNALLLPFGTTAGSSVAVFLDGAPYLQSPKADLLNPGAAPPDLPGVSGGGMGTDLLINGIAGTLTLDGNTNSGTAGKGNQAAVYAASENNLVDTAAGSPDIFGLGAGVLQAGFGAGNAYDLIDVNNAVSGSPPVAVNVDNNLDGNLVRVALVQASFMQAGPAFAAQQPGLVVDGGDEAAPSAILQPNGIGPGESDVFNVTSSPLFNIQVNGNLPTLTTVGGVPQGDQLNLHFVGSVNVFSDNASPPNVTLTDGGVLPSPFGVKYSSIERVNASPGNGVVNIIGNNNVVGNAQDDYFKVVGGPDPLGTPHGYLPPNVGTNQFSLQIGGSWDPATGAVGTPDVDQHSKAGLSSAIYFFDVNRINASGGAATGFDPLGNAIPDTSPTTGVNALDITPWANNNATNPGLGDVATTGWGIETYWSQGQFNNHDGGKPNDLTVFSGMPGVSENITVAPSAAEAGQIYATNPATGNTSVAVVNYTGNSNIIVNGTTGAAGDNDTLTLLGTNPGNPSTSGNEDFLANFAATGDSTHPLVRVYDAGAAPTLPRPSTAETADTAGALASALYNLQNITNINTLNVSMVAGSDLFDLISGRTDGSLTLNVDGGPPAGPGNTLNSDTVEVDGSTAGGDSFALVPGATSDAGTVTTTLSTATAPTVLNFTGAENVRVVGKSSAGSDSLTINGTGGNDQFTVTPSGVGATTGAAQIDSGPAITFTGLGSGAGTSLTLNGLGGSDSFALTQATTGPIPTVNVKGSVTLNGGTSTASITGDGAADTFNVTGGSPNSATVVVNGAAGTTYNLSGLSSDLLDGGLGLNGSTLKVAATSATVTPGSSTGSGVIVPLEPGNITSLPITYVHMTNPITLSGTTTLTVNANQDNETIAVDGAGNVTVTNTSTGVINSYAAAAFKQLVIDASGNNDLVTVASSANFVNGVVVNGNGSTSLTVTAGAALATVEFATNDVIGVVGGPISFAGVSNLTVSSAATALAVTGYGDTTTVTSLTLTGAATIAVTTGAPGPSTINYTPLSGASATLSRVEGGPAISITGFNSTDGSLTLNKAGNVLDVNFEGSTSNDAITVTHLAAGGTHVVDLIGGAVKWVPIDIGTGLSTLSVLGNLGNDSLTVDDTTGPVALAGGIFFDGGPGSNTLSLIGTTAATTDTYAPGPGTGQGSDTMTFAGPPAVTQKVSFANLAPVVDVVPSPILTVNGTNANDAINYSADPTIAGNGLVSVNNLETISFLNKTNLTINDLAGGDTINLNNSATPAGLTSITVNGGGPTVAGDTLVVNGTAAITYTPAAADATGGSLTGTGPVPISFTAISQLNINAHANALTIVSPAGIDNIALTPGATFDSGSLTDSNATLGTIVPVAFSHLAGSLTLKDTGGAAVDSLTYNGTAANDTFNVVGAGGGTITLNSQVPVSTPGIANLTLNGLAGDDLFNLTGALPYTTTTVSGGEPSASDVASLTGATGAVTVNLGDNAAAPPTNTTITGYGGTVTLTGVEVANLDAGGNALTAVGTAHNDNLTYTPSGPTAGTFSNAGLNTTFNFAAVGGAFTITGGAGGADSLNVDGSTTRDLFEIDQGGRTVQVLAHNTLPWKTVTIDATISTLIAVGLSGQDTFQVIPAAGVGAFPTDNLLIDIDGDSGPTGANNAVVLGGSFGAAPTTLPATTFVADNRAQDLTSGTLRVYQSAVANPDINYTNIQVVSPNVATTGVPNGNLLIMGPDVNEPNETQVTATNLGTAGNTSVSHAAIFSNNTEFPGVPADNDFYKVLAQQTGTIDFVATFNLYSPALLPAGGNLNLQVLDAAGNVVATASGGAPTFGAVGATANARIRIPVVAGQTYTLHVFGANVGGTPNAAVVNGYNLSIVNTPAIVPFNLELSRSVPAGVAGTPDTGDLPPNSPGDDSGRSQFDNVTNDNTPRIYLRLSDAILLNDLPGNGVVDAPPVGVIPIPFVPNATTPGFRVAIFDGNDTHTPVGFATQVAGFPGIYEFDFPAALADGIHNLTAEVQMVDPAVATETGFGATSLTLSITIDTVPPPVAFGSTGVANSGLVGTSDSGVPGQPATIVDRITNVSTPTLYGKAEANSIVRLYDDLNGDGVVDAGDVFLGQATAIPDDGTNAFPNGHWTITSDVDLNNPKLGFPLDGVRNLLTTAEDLAGNVSAPSKLTIFVDTQGPTVSTVSINGAGTFPLFNTKLTPTAVATPTPLISALDVTFHDNPVRVGPDFVYPAVNPILATTTSNYALVGEHTGVIPISSVTLVDNTAAGTIGNTTVTLHFPPQFTPLPDDRYTLTVSDQITDNPGNPLQGSFNGGSFPSGLASGNGSQGVSFVGAFTVNSRADLANYSAGTVDEDINGNLVFDPNNPDAQNRDAVVTIGYATDRVFSGNFSTTYGAVPPAAGVANGFDKLAAYGQDATGQWRFLYNLSGTGGAVTAIPEPFAIDGLPVAGNFDGSAVVAGSNPPVTKDGDQVGLFDGHTWYLDVLNQGFISIADVAAPATAVHPAGKLPSDMTGLPFVGIFDGFTDLGTYQNGILEFDLASLDPGHILSGNWNVKINITDFFLTGVQTAIPFNAVTARPVVGYFNGLGQEASLGFYVPGGTTNDPGVADWYIFEPTNSTLTGAPPIPAASLFTSGQVVTATAGQQAILEAAGSYLFNIIHPFKDQPLGGTDEFDQFGNQFSLPVVGVWDPPGTGLTTGTLSPSTAGSYVSDLYNQILGRDPSASELTSWVNAINTGMTPEQVAQTFVTSNEYRATVINQLYEQYLGRAADPSGTAWWTAIWNATGGPEAVQAGIIGSPEYYATAGKQYPSLSPDAAWVTALYHDLLNRDVDPAGLAYWVNYIQTNTKQSVVIGFVTSDEYRLNLIGDLFQTYLGRSLDSGSGQAILQQMQNGLTQDQLFEMIVSSQEYVNKQ